MRNELLDLLQNIVEGHETSWETLGDDDGFDEAIDKMYTFIISNFSKEKN